MIVIICLVIAAPLIGSILGLLIGIPIFAGIVGGKLLQIIAVGIAQDITKIGKRFFAAVR